MAWDKLRSRADIAAAYETIPSPQKMSVRDYRLPPTTKSDFKRFLMHDTESNHTFE